MINKNIIKTITDQDMDRKDFLKYSGLAILGLVGLKTVASLLTQSEIQRPVTINESSAKAINGFGRGSYGA